MVPDWLGPWYAVPFVQQQPLHPWWIAGPVSTCQIDPPWFGASRHGAQEAELTAVSVTLLWTLTLQGSVPFSIASDSLSTVRRSGGLWKFDLSDALPGACRALGQAAEVFGCRPWEHVAQAHSGFGWNELADTVAKLSPQTRVPRASLLSLTGSGTQAQPTAWPKLQGQALEVSPVARVAHIPVGVHFGSLPHVPSILIDECLARGLQPNLAAGKTEAVVAVHGSGARAARRQHLKHKQPTVAVPSISWPHARLRIVPSYRHLGGRIHHHGRLSVEIRVRVGQAWSSYQFAQSCIALHEKMVMFRSLICSFFFTGLALGPTSLPKMCVR